MPSSRIPSPARSQGARSTPRRYKPRTSRSLCSPARSNSSVKLSAVIMSRMDSFVLSPMPTRRSVLADTTDIDMPRRRSWWRKLGENSREIMEVLNSKEPVEADNAIEEYIDVDVLSQEKKNYTFDLPESSDSESISSIVIPQRKLFTQKENKPQKKFGQIINTRESLAKLHKSQAIDEKALNVGPKNLFNQGNKKPRSKPIFPSALLNISANKTIANKTKDQPINEVRGQVRSLFGNKQGTKRKNMFADFIVSESEDEIPVTDSQKLEPKRKASFNNHAEREPSPASITDIEIDDWRLLPSSTMVDHQLEEGLRMTPNKRARLDKESNNTIGNKTKQSNKSVNSKNKSKTKVSTNATKNEDKVDDDIDVSISQNQSTRKSLRKKNTSSRNTSLERSAGKENNKTKDIRNTSKMHTQKVNSNNVAVENDSKNVEASDKPNQTKTRSKIDDALQSEDDEDDFTLEYDNDDEPVKENETIRENKTQNAQHISKVGKDNITSNISKELQKISKENKDQADNEDHNTEMQIDNMPAAEADETGQNRENYNQSQNAGRILENYTRAEMGNEHKHEQYDEEMQKDDWENQEHNYEDNHTDKQLETSLKITPNKKVRESCNATANKTSQFKESMVSETNSKNVSKINKTNKLDNMQTVEESQHYIEEEMQKSKDVLQEVENDAEEMELENEDKSEAEEVEKHKNDYSANNESQEMASNEEDQDSVQKEHENDLQERERKEVQNDQNQRNYLEEHGQENNTEEQETDQGEQDDENDQQEPDQNYNNFADDDGQEANISNKNDISGVEDDVDQEEQDSEDDQQEPDQDYSNSEDDDGKEANVSNQNGTSGVEDDVDQDEQNDQDDIQEADNTDQNVSQEVQDDDEMEDQEESEAEDEEQANDSAHDESQDRTDEAVSQDSVQNDSQELEDNDDGENQNELEIEEDEDGGRSQDSEDAEEMQTSHEYAEDDDEDATEEILDNDTDPNDVQSDSEHEVHDEIIDNDRDADDNNERSEQDNEVHNAEANLTHDTTGRNRKKHDPKVSSPEAILHDKTRDMESFVKGRNTSVRKTKSMIKSLNIRPSLAPVRESTGFSDGSRDSNAEGSGWDSHRTTRVTMRKTFGKDFTPRKSLRTLVMEKSAKRQTAANLETNAEISKHPQANSTELPEPFDMRDHDYDDDGHDDADDRQDMQESDHEVSRRIRQTTLESYLQKIKQQNADRRKQLDEEIRNTLQKNAPRADVFNSFKVPAIPKRRVRPVQTKPKAKPVKSVIPLDMLPPELLEDMKYKPPKRYRPANASWITKRLYKFLETKLEPKYDYKARIRSEKLVETIYNFTKEIRRQNVASTEAVDLLKHEMARLDVVKTHFEFYEFFHEFMPREVRVKVVPDVFNKISLPKHGVFSDILR